MNQNVTPDAGAEAQQAATSAPLRPMTEEELREIAAQEASQNAAHDAAVHNRAVQQTTANDHVYHDAQHPAVTGTGTGDNRDETSDPEIAAGVGGLGGAMVGGAAGALLGPLGALAGAVVGGLTGMGVSGLAVDAIDKVDDDDTTTGLPDHTVNTSSGDTTTPIV